MGLETRNGRGAYYTRSRKVRGRVIREYVASGETAVLLAQLDMMERRRRQERRDAERWERERLAPLDELLAFYFQQCRAALFAELRRAGYHQHDRGEWRRKRA